MAHLNPALDELASEIESIIDTAADSVDEQELVDRERAANEIVESARDRASRRERA